MKQVLILFGTFDGHSAKVAEKIAAAVRAAGHEAEIARDSGTDPSPVGYNAVIVVGGVNYGRFPKKMTQWAARHAAALNAMPSALFAVSGAACDGEKGAHAAESFVKPFVVKTGWTPGHVEHVAGAFPFTRYAWWKKVMMKLILSTGGRAADTTTDYDYTDWAKLDQAANAFMAKVN